MMNPTRRAILPVVFGAFAPLARLVAAKPDVSDDAINDMVRRKLASDPDVKGGNLNVDVKGGVVTLGGNVIDDRAKHKAEKLTKKIRGVKQVVNNLKVGR